MGREITSTVTVTESLESTPTALSSNNGPASSDGPGEYLPIPEASTTVILGTGASAITAAVTEGSMFVQTTGVSQGTPSFPEPSATDATPAIPDPTAPPFTCPDDNGQTISQMLGSERFDYDVFCDMDLPTTESIPIDLSYATLAECVAMCSLSNVGFNQAVCQGVAYFEASGTNCFLKGVANVSDAVGATGVDLAILRRIAVGISDDNAEGTNTEVIAFSEETPTMAPSEIANMIGEMMGDSTASVPIITPPPGPIGGRPAVDGVTAYSTYVSNGETVSTGTFFSSYFSGNGSWYYTYASAWSLVWTDVQTVYSAGETAIPVAVNNTGTTQESNGNGRYTEITTSNVTTISYQSNQTVYDTTELIGNNTYNANNSLIASTTTTNFYTYTLAAENGSGGGNAGNGAGIITSTNISTYSTNSVIYSSGVTGGSFGGQGSGGQVIQTPAPVLTSVSAFSTESVVLIPGNSAGGGGGAGGGAGGETSLAEGVTSTITSAFSTEFVIAIPGNSAGNEGGEGGGAGSSAITSLSSTRGSFTNTGALRTPKPGDSDYVSSTEASGPAPYPSATVTPSVGIPPLNESLPVPSGTAPGSFTNPQTLRTGELSTTSGPVPYPPLSTSPSGVIPPTNESFPVPTGTAPLSFTNSQTLRTGFQTTSSGSVPYPPLSTSPSGVIPPTNESLPVPTGTGPVPYPPLSTSPSTATLPLNSSVPVGTGTAPPVVQTLSLLTGTTSRSFTNSDRPRSGTVSTGSASATSRPMVVQTLSLPSLVPRPSITAASIALSTGGMFNSTIPPFPTGTAPPATSCPPMAVSITTMWATTTLLGCYEQCPPGGSNHGGFYGGAPPVGSDGYSGPQSFGPPAAIFAPTLIGNPIPESTSPAAPYIYDLTTYRRTLDILAAFA